MKKQYNIFLGLLVCATIVSLQANYKDYYAVQDREMTAMETREQAEKRIKNHEKSGFAAKRLHEHAGYSDNHAKKEMKDCKHCGAAQEARENAHAGYSEHRKCEHPLNGKREIKECNSKAVIWAKDRFNAQTQLAEDVRNYMSSDDFKNRWTLNQRRIKALNKEITSGSLDKKKFDKVLANRQVAVKLVFDYVKNNQ